MSQVEFNFKEFAHKIEPKWQKFWQDKKVYKAANPGEAGSEKPKFYNLVEFPYPSMEGHSTKSPMF